MKSAGDRGIASPPNLGLALFLVVYVREKPVKRRARDEDTAAHADAWNLAPPDGRVDQPPAQPEFHSSLLYSEDDSFRAFLHHRYLPSI